MILFLFYLPNYPVREGLGSPLPCVASICAGWCIREQDTMLLDTIKCRAPTVVSIRFLEGLNKADIVVKRK